MKLAVSVFLFVAFSLCAHGLALAQEASSASLPHIQVDLLTPETVGDKQIVDVRFRIDGGWHIYGQNPGDIGRPTVITLKLPDGLKEKDLPWPEPSDFHTDGLISHGYDGEVTISKELTGSIANSGEISVEAGIDWLLCSKEECLPQNAILRKNTKVSPSLLATSTTAPMDVGATGSSDSSSGIFSLLFFKQLLLAFIGGIILNLMPCVFPVISLKILSFAGNKKSDRHALHHGILYSAGVILSFWVLGGAFLLLRAAGHAAGWGFQFQSPVFVACMAFVVFAIALNLVGVFEIGMSVQRIAGNTSPSSGSGNLGAFFSGVLSTLLATPCSAPFMASAIAATMTMTAIPALLIFTSLGIGMALPYVLLSAFPSWLRFLPKPGAWMLRLKQLLAFPLFATVIWLTWVLNIQTGSDGLLQFLLGVLLLSFGLWIFGNWAGPYVGNIKKRIATTSCTIAIGAACYVGIPFNGVPPTTLNTGTSDTASELSWEPYSAARLFELRSASVPVLVEFTAAWCVTCQVNHQVLFNSTHVISKIKDAGVKVLIADWTNNDLAVTAAIKEHGRSGVPLTVFYDPTNKEPRILPQILTPGELIATLEEATRNKEHG